MTDSIGVVVVHDDPQTTEAIVETVESARDLFVAATSTGSARSGTVVVAGGDALVTLPPVDLPLVALAEEDPIRAARAALAAAAREIVRWPQEAERLAAAIRRAAGSRGSTAAGGRAIAVLGARGGAGTTVVVAVLGAALDRAIVVDLDTAGAGQRALAVDEPTRALGDVRGSLADCLPDALSPLLTPHAGDARAIHAEPMSEPFGPREVHGLVRAAMELSPWVIIDCARAETAGQRAAVAIAEHRLLVVPNDVASVRGARTLAERLPPLGLVVRRARRGGVAVRDLAASLGSDPVAVVREDRSLARAHDLGTIPARPTRAVRALRTLAARLRDGG